MRHHRGNATVDDRGKKIKKWKKNRQKRKKNRTKTIKRREMFVCECGVRTARSCPTKQVMTGIKIL